MTPRRVRVRPLLVLAVLLLAGCGGDPSGAGDAGEEAAAPAAVAEVPPPAAPTDPAETADPRTQALSDLAALAQQAASQAPTAAPLPATGAQAQLEGSDISWPNCPPGLGIPERPTKGLPGPLPTAQFVVIGLTNGPGFTTNPCLGDQVGLARSRGLRVAAYAVVSYPDAATVREHGADGPYDATTPAGLLRNVGYAQARAGAASMATEGLSTPIVWLDVESVPGFDWSGDTAANAAVVEGAARGYREAGYTVGVYSTAYLWRSIVGGLTLGAPEWRPVGPSSRATAEARCDATASIQGGPAVLVQWVDGQRDRDVTCPVLPGQVDDYFGG